MLTVILATHNGADTLARTLTALARSAAPAGGWKLVVVDNASTDETASIIDSWCDQLPIAHLFEPRIGKTNALNTGIKAAIGDLVVFTDDDVLPDSDWLVKWREGADRHPDCQLFGGAILPQWDTPPPSWILRNANLKLLYALTDPGWAEGPIRPSLIFGPNMAVRTVIFEQGEEFSTQLGPAGRSGLMGDETEFMTRLASQGYRTLFCPAPIVRHIVQKDQLSLRWVLNRSYRFGASNFQMEWESGSLTNTKFVLGFPRHVVRRLAQDIFFSFRALSTCKSDNLFHGVDNVFYDIGELFQGRRIILNAVNKLNG